MQASARIQALCARLGVELALATGEQAPWHLEVAAGRLQLRLGGAHARFGPVSADFVTGAARFRRTRGGSEAVARAVGVRAGRPIPSVVDATAGLGRDAFVLASAGCRVTMLERSPVVAALLQDALDRAADAPDADVRAARERMHLEHADALAWLPAHAGSHDAVLLDPMYHAQPGRTAAPRKELVALQTLLGVAGAEADVETRALLAAALASARATVALKRPRHAPVVAPPAPAVQLVGSSTRYDVYAPMMRSKR